VLVINVVRAAQRPACSHSNMGNWIGRDRDQEGPPAAHKVQDVLEFNVYSAFLLMVCGNFSRPPHGAPRDAMHCCIRHGRRYTRRSLHCQNAMRLLACVQNRPLPKTVDGIPADWVEGDIAARQPNLEGDLSCCMSLWGYCTSSAMPPRHATAARHLAGCLEFQQLHDIRWQPAPVLMHLRQFSQASTHLQHWPAACAFEAMTVQRCLFLNDYDISRCKLEIAVSDTREIRRPSNFYGICPVT
jgi:hypothetical protein